jgi:hypothetical protein
MGKRWTNGQAGNLEVDRKEEDFGLDFYIAGSVTSVC